MPRHFRSLGLALLTISMFETAPGTANAEGSTEVVETLHAALIEVMENAETLGYSGRYAVLDPVIRASFDSEFMARKTIGRHWKEMNEVDRERWLDHFVRYTVSNYAGRFAEFQGEHFETHGEEEAPHDTVLVRTTLVVPSDKNVDLNYRLRPVSGGWRIVDIYMNGTVSELALRRSEYGSTLKREGFEVLVGAIAQKITALEGPETQTEPASIPH